MIKTLITGGHGFIGKYLVEKLPHSVHLEHEEDLGHGRSWNAEQLFFLSTYGNMAHHTVTSMMVQANVIDLLTTVNGFKGWLCYMSSSSVTLPVQTPYSRTKRAAEEILQALPELKSCIVRPYSVTGVGEQKEHLIPTLIRSCMEGEEMPFDPYPVHDFIDVEDVVDGLLWLSERQVKGIYEFGSGIGYTNEAVKQLIEEATGKKANVKETKALRPYDSPNWYCRNPSFKPKKSLVTSIQEMVEAYH